MFGKKRKLKKDKARKQKNPERSAKIRESVYDLGGAGAGLCAGMVIDAGLNMIPCPAVKPITKTAFKVGKFVLSGIGGKLVSNLARAEIKETVDGATETIAALKQGKEAETPILEEGNSEKEDDEQVYEVDE